MNSHYEFISLCVMKTDKKERDKIKLRLIYINNAFQFINDKS